MSWIRHVSITADYDYDPATDLLGKGAYGAVYRCTERSTRRQFALKVVPIDQRTSLDGEFMEIEILKRLNHPHCIAIHDFGVYEGQLFIVQELIAGGELLQYLTHRRATGNLTESDIRQVMKQILEALVYLHTALHIVHRDLKPENILISMEPTLQIKLIDFGQAKYFGRPEDFEQLLELPVASAAGTWDLLDPLENSESFVECSPKCTPSYGAFEIVSHIAGQHGQFRDHGFAKHCTTRKSIQKVDLFSAGVVLYLMLSGRLPFLKATETPSFALLQNRMESGLKFPDAFWNGISEDAKDLVARLLSLKPADRPTAKEALRHPWFQQPLGVPVAEVPPPPPPESYDDVRQCAAGMTSAVAQQADWARSPLFGCPDSPMGFDAAQDGIASPLGFPHRSSVT